MLSWRGDYFKNKTGKEGDGKIHVTVKKHLLLYIFFSLFIFFFLLFFCFDDFDSFKEEAKQELLFIFTSPGRYTIQHGLGGLGWVGYSTGAAMPGLSLPHDRLWRTGQIKNKKKNKKRVHRAAKGRDTVIIIFYMRGTS